VTPFFEKLVKRVKKVVDGKQSAMSVLKEEENGQHDSPMDPS
jgi:hypothetical protein